MIQRAVSFLRRWSFPVISVVGTGLVGAVCIALMTAGKFEFVAPEAAAKLAIFIVFQTLGVTVVKAGLDSYLFARASSASGADLYELGPIFKRYIVPVWIVFVAASYVVLESPFVAAVCGVATLIDVYSAVRVAELTARNSFGTVAAANLAKYPLYFVLLLVLGSFGSVSYGSLLYLYLLVIGVRFLVVFVRIRGAALVVVPGFSFGLLGVQQILNYLLFRLDQASIPVVRDHLPGLRFEGLSQFVFLVKFPELTSYCITAIGSIFFPVVARRWAAPNSGRTRERVFANLTMLVLCLGGLLVYLAISDFGMVRPVVFIPLVLAAFLCLEVNFITFRLLAGGALRQMLIGLAGAVVVGISVVVLAMTVHSTDLLYWVVPLQMTLYIFVVTRVSAR